MAFEPDSVAPPDAVLAGRYGVPGSDPAAQQREPARPARRGARGAGLGRGGALDPVSERRRLDRAPRGRGVPGHRRGHGAGGERRQRSHRRGPQDVLRPGRQSRHGGSDVRRGGMGRTRRRGRRPPGARCATTRSTMPACWRASTGGRRWSWSAIRTIPPARGGRTSSSTTSCAGSTAGRLPSSTKRTRSSSTSPASPTRRRSSRATRT